MPVVTDFIDEWLSRDWPGLMLVCCLLMACIMAAGRVLMQSRRCDMRYSIWSKWFNITLKSPSKTALDGISSTETNLGKVCTEFFSSSSLIVQKISLSSLVTRPSPRLSRIFGVVLRPENVLTILISNSLAAWISSDEKKFIIAALINFSSHLWNLEKKTQNVIELHCWLLSYANSVL